MAPTEEGKDGGWHNYITGAILGHLARRMRWRTGTAVLLGTLELGVGLAYAAIQADESRSATWTAARHVAPSL